MNGSGERAIPCEEADRRERDAKLASRPDLAALAARTRPAALAAEDVLPVGEALANLLGGAGLRRGWTVVVDGQPGSGTTSLLLQLLSAPTAAGAWCALVGLPGVGVVAAEEMGVALDRLLLVPDPGERPATVAAALLEGCDLVAVRPGGALAPREAARLVARARERRGVLVVVGAHGGVAGGPPPGWTSRAWAGEVDVHLEAGPGRWVGIGDGHGRLVAHLVEVLAHLRRGAPGARRSLVCLQGCPGGLAAASGEPITVRQPASLEGEEVLAEIAGRRGPRCS